MSRYNIIEKTIHGEPVTQTVFLSKIAEAILDKPEGLKAAELVPYLGPEWDNPPGKKVISQTLMNMAKRGTLAPYEERRGAYVVTQYAVRNGVSNFDSVEKSILAVIREQGGFCRFKDIMEAHGVRVAGADKDVNAVDPVYRRILQVIEKSDLIRQDFAVRGIYNLPWAELGNMPIRGRWISMIAHVNAQELSPNWATMSTSERLERGFEMREFLYASIGIAFRQLRRLRGISISELFDEAPKIEGAAEDFVRDAPAEVAAIRQDWFDRTAVKVDEMRESGATLNDIDDYREAREEELKDRLAEWLYSRFEKGQAGAHYAAPQHLYTAVAEHFDICPAALSRGMIFMHPYEERIRPNRTRRHWEEILDARLESESAIEATKRALKGESNGD